MAKTIEEKANDKYNNPVEPYCFETDTEEQWYGCGLRDGYIEGAEDQRKIDIEKAWTLFEKYATYIHPRKGEETCIMTKYKFIEAMEKE